MAKLWYYMQDEQELGPLSAQELKLLATSGKLNRMDMVRREGMSDWVKAKQVSGLFPSTKHAAQGRLAVPPPPPLPQMPLEDTKSSKENPEIKISETDTSQDNTERIDSKHSAYPYRNLGITAGSVALGFIVYRCLRYMGFEAILSSFVSVLHWGLVIVALLAALLMGYVISKSDDKDERIGGGIFTILLVGAALGIHWLFGGFSSEPSYRRLPKVATAEEITRAYQPYVYYLTTSNDMQGSGILIANNRSCGIIATNRHVVQPTDTIELGTTINISAVSSEGHVPRRVKLAATHLFADLALVLVHDDFSNKGSVPIVPYAQISQGEQAIALGNPQGVPFITSTGVISGKPEGVITTSCPISPGSSGGPLLLARHGWLAGINTATYLESQNLNFAIPAEYLLPSLCKPATSQFVVGSRNSVPSWVWAEGISTTDKKTVERLLDELSLVSEK